MRAMKEINLQMKDYLRYYQLISLENHHKLISLSQGDFGDDSPKVPASEVNLTKTNLHRKGGL
jgi:hypothetical protein